MTTMQSHESEDAPASSEHAQRFAAHEYPIQQVVDSLTLAVDAYMSASDDLGEDDSPALEELESRVAELTYLVKHSADGSVLGVESVTALIAYGGPTETVTFTQEGTDYHTEVWSSWAPDSPSFLLGSVADTLAQVWGVDYIFETAGES